jgi:predicted RNase H-like HicB family nuclease
MLQDRYIYPAVFDYADDGISIRFPDLPGCFTCGDTEEEALRMARDALAGHIYHLYEQQGEKVPEPSPAYKVEMEQGHTQAVVLVEVWMPPFRDEMEEKAVKKTVTLPKWLRDLGEEKDVNFSRLLQDALKNYLGVRQRKKDVK